MVVPANQNDPADEAEAQAMTISSRQPRRDRQDAAEQTRAAVEHHREDRAADDQQQRLGQDDDADDRAGPCRTTRPRVRISRRTTGSRNSAGPGPLDVRLGSGSAALAISFVGPQRVAGAAGAEAPEPAQRVPPDGRAVEREGDELGAAADILDGTGPPRPPCHSGDPAVGANRRDCRPSGRHGRRGRGSGRNCRSARAAQLDRVVAAAVGQGFADDRHAATGARRSAGAESRQRRIAGRCRTANWHRSGSRRRAALALHRLAVDDQLPLPSAIVSPGRPMTRLI